MLYSCSIITEYNEAKQGLFYRADLSLLTPVLFADGLIAHVVGKDEKDVGLLGAGLCYRSCVAEQE